MTGTSPSNDEDAVERLVRTRPVVFGLVAVFAVGVVARIALKVLFGRITHPQLWEFGEIAKNLLATGTYSYRSNGLPSAYMPPGYPLVIALFYRLFGIGTAAHIGLAGFLFAFEIAIPFLVGWLAAQVWNRAAGIVAFALASIWPQFLLLSGRFSSLQIYTALLVLACAVLFSRRLGLPAKASLGGLVLGLYANFRFDALPYSLAFLYYLVRETKSARRGALGYTANLGLFVVFLLAPLSPWIVRNYRVYGQFVLGTSGGYNLRRGHHEHASGTGRDPWPASQMRSYDSVSEGTPVPGEDTLDNVVYRTPRDLLAVDTAYRDAALEYAVQHPLREAKLVALKLYYFLVTDFTHPVARLPAVWLPSFVALLVGLFFWLRTGLRDPRQQALWMVFAVQAGLAVVFFVLPRYRMVVDFVPLVFFAAWLATTAIPWLLRRLWRDAADAG